MNLTNLTYLRSFILQSEGWCRTPVISQQFGCEVISLPPHEQHSTRGGPRSVTVPINVVNRQNYMRRPGLLNKCWNLQRMNEKKIGKNKLLFNEALLLYSAQVLSCGQFKCREVRVYANNGQDFARPATVNSFNTYTACAAPAPGCGSSSSGHR